MPTTFQSVFLESVFFRDYSGVAFLPFLFIFSLRYLQFLYLTFIHPTVPLLQVFYLEQNIFLKIHKRQQSPDQVFKVNMMNCCDNKSCLTRKVIKIFVWLSLPEVSIHRWQDCIWTDSDCLQFYMSQMRQQNIYFFEFLS